MNNEKIIFEVPMEKGTPEAVKLTRKARIYLSQLNRETGLKNAQIIEKVLEFAMDKYEIRKI